MKVKTQENVNKMVLRDLNQALSETFNDYQGSYFFGSRTKGILNTDSNFDIVPELRQKIACCRALP